MTDSSHIKSVVEQYVSLVGCDDATLVADLYAQDAQLEDPVGSEPRVGRAAILEFYAALVGSGVKATLTGPARVVGNEVAFPFEISSPGFSMPVIDVMRFDDEGKIMSMRAFWEMPALG